jgi:hypothetical protein
MSSSGGVSSGGSTHRPPHPHFRVLQQALAGGDHVVGKGGINLESRGRGACGSNGCGHAGLGPLDAAAASFAAGQPAGDRPATPCPCRGTHPVLQDDAGQAQATQALLPLGRGHQAAGAVARRRQHLRLLLVALCGQAGRQESKACSFIYACIRSAADHRRPLPAQQVGRARRRVGWNGGGGGGRWWNLFFPGSTLSIASPPHLRPLAAAQCGTGPAPAPGAPCGPPIPPAPAPRGHPPAAPWLLGAR